MPEVKVEEEKSLSRQRTSGLSAFNEFYNPMFPVGRLFRMSPFAMMRDFSDEMDRMFRDAAPSLEAWAPVMDIQRVNGDLLITAELPGLKKEEVKVELTEDALIVEGERKCEHKEEHKGYHHFERSYGKFYRSIPLPEGASLDQVKAELNDGVLKISVPVPEVKKKVRQVAVEEVGDKQPFSGK